MDPLTVEAAIEVSESPERTFRLMVLHDPSAHQIYVIGRERGWDDARIMRILALYFFGEHRRQIERQVEEAMNKPRPIVISPPPASPPAR